MAFFLRTPRSDRLGIGPAAHTVEYEQDYDKRDGRDAGRLVPEGTTGSPLAPSASGRERHISQDWSIGFILTNSEFVRIKTLN
jgi:hypothetical protein